MFSVLSPAKKLNFDAPATARSTGAQLLEAARELHQTTRELTAADLARLMKLSGPLAQLNFERFQGLDLSRPRPPGSRPAILVFDGDTYVGLQARAMDDDQLAFAQEHLGILSGLYGLLRPLDAILPYRLEMSTALATPRGKDLYEFWGDRVVRLLTRRMKKAGTDTLINLASVEYFKVLDRPSLQARVITPIFKERRGTALKVVSFCAKRARGAMARYIMEHRLTDPSGLRKFRGEGYRFVAAESDEHRLLFVRAAK